MNRYFDTRFGAAVLAAPFVWGALVLLLAPALQPAWPLERPGSFLLLVVAYPVLEELAFRGLLQGWLRKAAWGRRERAGISGANLATSLAFALAHLVAHPWPWAAAAFVPSLVFGYFRDRTGSVLPAILLHAWYNAGFFWLFPPTP